MNKGIMTIAVCTYNRSARLPGLVEALRRQQSPVPFEILIVNNHSDDDTLAVLEKLRKEPGIPLRFVTEYERGIVAARNRAIAEAMDSEYLAFIDDDELPRDGFVAAMAKCFEEYPEAGCIGGRVKVDFAEGERPGWLNNDLLGFLAESDYGSEGFWIRDEKTPLWTANIAYRMGLFRKYPELRFDQRYSRVGTAVGGGEDAIMFRELLRRGVPTRYCPDMVVDHAVERWRLRPAYFLRLHCLAGFKAGRWELEEHLGGLLGVPLFLVRQWMAQLAKTFRMLSQREPGALLRQSMTAAHTLGMIFGCHARWRDAHFKSTR
jgi:glycosyltransferase involved in cell wall biosynthesis